MSVIAAGTHLIDLEHLGQPRAIGACLLDCGTTMALVDPGPGVSLPTLLLGLEALGVGLEALGAILLTHIHLDHAGATGALVRRNPAIRVFVHERGAPHLIDPERLLRSAALLYGEEMDRLWGEFLAVPRANVAPLAGGETLDIGDRRFEVAYTPGHASHHVSYFERAQRLAFTGDAAGCRISDTGFVLPPTPPPDIHVPKWLASLETIRAFDAESLVLTHFGPVGDAAAHLDALAERLTRWSNLVKEALLLNDSDRARLEGGDDPARLEGGDDPAQPKGGDDPARLEGGDDRALIADFEARVVDEMAANLDPAALAAMRHAAPPATYWAGLA
ncbi:MAG: MBL fold metallo-hydrolase, partial [Myxococcales bacterium]|nr:MBL fold metallo-hydrolase [Myxococcales bacterium]